MKDLVSLISYVVVDPEDPAFKSLSKPIGPVFTPERAAALPYPTMKTSWKEGRGPTAILAEPHPRPLGRGSKSLGRV